MAMIRSVWLDCFVSCPNISGFWAATHARQRVFGNVLVNENFLKQMNNPSVSLQGNLTSVYNLGCFAGAISTMWTGDMLGRPKTLIVGSGIVSLGAIMQHASYNPAQMLVACIIGGFGTGMNTATAGVWQSETSNNTSRGKLITIQMSVCALGLALANWLTPGLSFAHGSVS